MNKGIKKIIAVALTVSAFCAIAPATNLNIMTVKAYAVDNSTTDLSQLRLKTSSGSTIKIYDDNDYKSKNQVDSDEVKDGDTYYAKTSSSKVKISTSGPSSNYVRVFKSTSSSAKGSKTSSSISISSGTTTLAVRVYDEDPGSSVKYSNKDNVTSEYKIKVKYTGSSDDDDDEDEDDVYLKSISLSEGDISFSKRTSTYNINVDTSIDEVKITAKPDCDSDDYDDYEVRIDGTTVDEDDKFKKTVDLDKGKNEIKITVEDNDDNKKTYTLNITRGTTTSTNNSGSTTTNNGNKINQWVSSNGRWTYNDASGKPLKSTWFYDKNYGKTYYLQDDGSMATGWLYKDGMWYYLSGSGDKQTGWALISGSWYYLDSEGKMQTGWLKDWTGKWYYLQSSGVMAKNTTISGYKLGTDGSMTK